MRGHARARVPTPIYPLAKDETSPARRRLHWKAREKEKGTRCTYNPSLEISLFDASRSANRVITMICVLTNNTPDGCLFPRYVGGAHATRRSYAPRSFSTMTQDTRIIPSSTIPFHASLACFEYRCAAFRTRVLLMRTLCDVHVYARCSLITSHTQISRTKKNRTRKKRVVGLLCRIRAYRFA